MKQTQPQQLSEPTLHLCQSCGGPMRLIGSESDPVEADSDLLTYACTSCDEFLVLPMKIRQPTVDLFKSLKGFPDDASDDQIVIVQLPPPKYDNSHVTPVTCEKCCGRAHLTGCEPCATAPGIREIWTFQCEACGGSLKRTVEK